MKFAAEAAPQRVFFLFASHIQPKFRSSATTPVTDLVHHVQFAISFTGIGFFA